MLPRDADANEVRAFYDELASSYHLIFADWHASIERQAAALDRLIGEALGPGPQSILDCACGIGTQAIGLARLGHRVHAADLSPAAVARAEREAAAAGVAITFGVADLRELAGSVAGAFDVVLACDNALPHLLSDDDLRQATANLAAKIRPGGLFLASIRDYDRLARERPRTEGPRVIDGPHGRRVVFQVWDWADDGGAYRLQQFIVRETGARWRTDCFATDYRALLRGDLDAALRDAGLDRIEWREPDATGYFQPIVLARGRGVERLPR
jgi:SAM-dependent methyltransferase